MKNSKKNIGIFLSLFLLVLYFLFPLLMGKLLNSNFANKISGSNDAWIGFWGSYIGSGISTLLAGVIAFYVANKQVSIQARADSAREREISVIKIRLEKYQEVYRLLSDFSRAVTKADANLVFYRVKKISLEQFRIKDDNLQNEIMDLMRNIRSYEPFIDGLKENLDMIMNQYGHFANIIYDGYTYPNDVREKWEKDTSYEHFREISDKLIAAVLDLIKKISCLIQTELNKLND